MDVKLVKDFISHLKIEFDEVEDKTLYLPIHGSLLLEEKGKTNILLHPEKWSSGDICKLIMNEFKSIAIELLKDMMLELDFEQVEDSASNLLDYVHESVDQWCGSCYLTDQPVARHLFLGCIMGSDIESDTWDQLRDIGYTPGDIGLEKFPMHVFYHHLYSLMGEWCWEYEEFISEWFGGHFPWDDADEEE